MRDRRVSVLDGSTFVVGDRLGDVYPGAGGGEHGFFSDDTRFLSRWALHFGETPLYLLGLDQRSHFAAQFFMSPHVATDDAAPCSVVRHRLIDEVWMEEIRVVSHRHEMCDITLSLELETDFADLFEVKQGVVAEREITCSQQERSLLFSYENGEFRRSVKVSSTRHGPITPRGFTYLLRLSPGEEWSTTFTITPAAAQPGTSFRRRRQRGAIAALGAAKSAKQDEWLAQAPELRADDASLMRTYRASLSDLGALRMRSELDESPTLPAAGLPWFMALFGRDSLITSFQALPYLPGLAATTLRVLAGRQATERDDFHDCEPGKILHELRFGELTASGRTPHSPYYGTADATPLFLILLDEYHRWTGDSGLVRELESNARAALAWIDDSGDADGDGYVEYSCRNLATGLANQCWKDSWDSIQFADGRLGEGPIATCEIQGYVYDARLRSARLAREIWGDEVLAERLERQADTLRAQFHTDFWIPERGYHAIALDGEKRQVDGLSSNIGHLLWSGLLDEPEAAATAKRLLGDELFSGWGVRTLGANEAGYNPLGYHTGAVWPHENSLIAAGLARYGYRDAADTIARAMLRAAPDFEHRLPETFAGYPSSMTSVVVAFPTASRPQAWAAGTPLLLLTTLLRLEPGREIASAQRVDGLGAIELTKSGDGRHSTHDGVTLGEDTLAALAVPRLD